MPARMTEELPKPYPWLRELMAVNDLGKAELLFFFRGGGFFRGGFMCFSG